MAGNIKGITIEFNGDTTKLDKALRQINKETKDIDRELKQVDKALKFNPTSVELWRQKQQLLTQKVAETKTKLDTLKQAQAKMDAEGVDKNSEEYRKLQREIIVTGNQVKTFEGQLRKIGNVNLRAASEQFKELGNKLTSAGQAMREVSMAAAAVVGSLGAISYKAGQNADDLNTLSKVYSINTQDLQKYSVAADLVDVSVEDIAKSHVKLEKSMYSAQGGSASMNEAFEKLGVSVTNADGSLRSSDAVWQETISALGQMTNETERDALAQELMGKSAANLNPLIEDQGETYKNVADTMSKYGLDFVDQETLDKANEFNDLLDTMKVLGSVALADVGSKLAGYLVPALEKVVDWVGQLANWLSNLSPEVLTVIGVVASIIAVMAPVLLFLGKMSFAISSIMSLMATIGPAIAGVLATAGPIIAVIAAIIAVGVLLYKNWDTIKAKATEIWNHVKEVFTTLKNDITSIWNGVTNAVSTAWNAIKQFIFSVIGGIYNTINSRFNTIKSTIETVFNSIRSTASSVWNSIKSAITRPVETAFNTVKGWVNKLKDLFPLKVGKIFSNLKVPHIKVKGGTAPFGIGGKGTAPSISVDWYAKGGIFTRPTLLANGNRIAGVGEAGPEAVLPISKLQEMVDFGNQPALAIAEQQTQILLAIYDELQREKDFKVNGMWAGRYVNSLVR